MKDSDCIFCKLANGDIPTNVIYEDDDFTVILDAATASISCRTMVRWPARRSSTSMST